MNAAQELHETHKRIAELDVLCSWSLRSWLIACVPMFGLGCARGGDAIPLTWPPLIAVSVIWFVLLVLMFTLAFKHSHACNKLPEFMFSEDVDKLESEVLGPISDAVAAGEREAIREAGPAWVPGLLQEDQDAFLEECPKDVGVYETLRYLGNPTPKGHAVVSCNDCEVTEISSLDSRVIKRVVDPCEKHWVRVRAESCLPMSPYQYL